MSWADREREITAQAETTREQITSPIAFVGLGPGAGRWLKEAGPAGATRIRAKMARAVELAVILGVAKVDEALGLAAAAGRFGDALLRGHLIWRVCGSR
ncbi:hypothetical protein [Streptomyces sp. NPDC000618]|uniref:hypothetical protein n=1 Tax=Streptomyces sp. NPDC000618 TaxID=3154265 RepID=UPI003325ECF1